MKPNMSLLGDTDKYVKLNLELKIHRVICFIFFLLFNNPLKHIDLKPKQISFLFIRIMSKHTRGFI